MKQRSCHTLFPFAFCRLLLCGLFTLAVAAEAFAQADTASVAGRIVDAHGGLLAGATVIARNVESGFTRIAETNEEGLYRISAILPGEYEFTAKLAGFAASTRTGVVLALGSEAVLDFELAIADVAEELSVTADVPIVEVGTAAIQKTIDRDTLDLLPLFGRNYTSLLRLTPGSSGATSFAGSRAGSNAWMIDGVDNSADMSGGIRSAIALDAIKEVKILVNGFRAEFGQATGGVVNVITRSGSNDLHGSGFVLYRDERLMAQSPYADRSLPEPPVRRVHYGGALGGPIRENKLHYFIAYEREDRDTFSTSTHIYPARTAPFAPSTLQFLETHGIDLSLFPPTTGSRRLSRPEFVDMHKVSARIDSQLNDQQFLLARYGLDRNDSPSGRNGTLLDFSGSTDFSRDTFGNINHKWVISGDKLNELYVQLGQTGVENFSHFPNLPQVMVLAGGFSLEGGSDQRRTDYIYQFLNSFTWMPSGGRSGEHVVKLGAGVKALRSEGSLDTNFRGTFTFPNINRFVEGRPSRFTQNRGNSFLRRPNERYEFFIQDDWRPLRDLTLSLGLRYDYESAKTQALKEVTGTPGPGISQDKNNWAPRLGFAWAPGRSLNQVFYGGTGIYYDQIAMNILGNARFTPPRIVGLRIDNPRWPDPLAAGPVAIQPSGVSVIDVDLKTPSSWSSQVGYRREIRKDLGLDVSFLYKREEDQVAILNTNAGIPGTADLFGSDPVRPDPTVGVRRFFTNLGFIRYKGLLVDLRKRFSHNMQGSLAYTLSSAVDNTASFNDSIDVPSNPSLSNGPAGHDRRHRVRGHMKWVLPWKIELGTIVEYLSEEPLNIVAGGRDLDGDGSTGDWVNEAICLNISCPGFSYSRNSVRELSTGEANRLRALFGLPPIAQYANNPKLFNADITLQKRFRIGPHRLRVTAHGFNVFNVPQRDQPVQNILSSNFGRYLSVNRPRAVQFIFQYEF